MITPNFDHHAAPTKEIDQTLKRTHQIVSPQIAIGALAPGVWCFWTFAFWRSRLQTQLENLNTVSLDSGSQGNP